MTHQLIQFPEAHLWESLLSPRIVHHQEDSDVRDAKKASFRSTEAHLVRTADLEAFKTRNRFQLNAKHCSSIWWFSSVTELIFTSSLEYFL